MGELMGYINHDEAYVQGENEMVVSVRALNSRNDGEIIVTMQANGDFEIQMRHDGGWGGYKNVSIAEGNASAGYVYHDADNQEGRTPVYYTD